MMGTVLESTLTQSNVSGFPKLGFGLGLRPEHYRYIFKHEPKVGWFEIISENFMDTGGRPRHNLAKIKERYPIVMHGISLSIGSTYPLRSDYLKRLKTLADWVKPVGISDHLCWTGTAHHNSHDLLPVPYTEQALKHLVQRVKEVQDYLERPIALENPSTYLEYKSSYIPEAEFIARLAEESSSRILLDINNVYVTCFNHRQDPKAYLDSIPADKVVQVHLAGHAHKGSHIIDTHGAKVVDEVFDLYRYFIERTGMIPHTMIERDDAIPAFPEIFEEVVVAKRIAEEAAQASLEKRNDPKIQERIYYRSAKANVEAEPDDESLERSQAYVLHAITHPSEIDPSAWIRNKQGFPPRKQLGVYVNAYVARLYECVAEDFPCLRHYSGETAFMQMLHAFIKAVPPRHFNIARYSHQLPAFVANYVENDVFAQELAILEDLVIQVMHLPESDALLQEHLIDLTLDTLPNAVLRPREALALHCFSYPVNAYASAILAGKTPSVPKRKTSYTLIFRHDYAIKRVDIGKVEYLLLQAFLEGKTVGEAFACLENLDEEFDLPDISLMFSKWIQHGVLAAPAT